MILGKERKRGGALNCCCLCVLEEKSQQQTPLSPLRVHEIYDMRAAICINLTNLLLLSPQLCKLSQTEWDTIGMPSCLLFIKINGLAGDVCEEFISSSCISKCPKGEGAEEVGRGRWCDPDPAQVSHQPGVDHFGR
jgi:hypothetical protein